jgi:hypothetical protein
MNKQPDALWKKGEKVWLSIDGKPDSLLVSIDSEGTWDYEEQQWKYQIRQTDGKLCEDGNLFGEHDFDRRERLPGLSLRTSNHDIKMVLKGLGLALKTPVEVIKNLPCHLNLRRREKVLPYQNPKLFKAPPRTLKHFLKTVQ